MLLMLRLHNCDERTEIVALNRFRPAGIQTQLATIMPNVYYCQITCIDRVFTQTIWRHCNSYS